jgi:hypothetical protein
MKTSLQQSTAKISKIKILGVGILAVVLGLLTLWAFFALYFTLPVSPWRLPLAIAYGLFSLILPLVIRPRRYGILASAGLFVLVVGWFFSLPASNTRNWQADTVKLPSAEINADTITLHNIRSCDYRSETDFTCRYYDRTVSLLDLQTIDLFMIYWGSPNIAHTMMSFGFKDGGYVCFSIETRKEIGEEYSAIKGFFRQYEQTYVMADERDVVRLRTNYRNEDVYLYPLRVAPETARKVFLHYLDTVNSLYRQPEWYNALTANCTTSIRQHTLPYNPEGKFDWRMIVNGYLDEMIYQRGVVDTSMPFAEFKRRSFINPKAVTAPQDHVFSRYIRQSLPGKTL